MTFDPDPEQRRVLDHGAGPLLLVGPAGSGKTSTLRERFVRLLEDGADPERVALVARSRRERDVLRRALLQRIQRPLPTLRVTTIHGLAFHVVGHRHDALGLREPPQVYSAADQFAKVQELLRGEDPAEWPAYGGLLQLRGFADQVRQFLNRAQEAMRSPDDIERAAERAGLTGWSELARFYRQYLDVLEDLGIVDFAGLVRQAVRAAGEGEPALDHLLVDDHQDTTLGAAALIEGLRSKSLVVAGDPDAHVFSFQGTTDEPLRALVLDTPAERRVTLSHRYRGEEVALDAWCARHTSAEHAAVARELRRIHLEDGVAWRELAVVVRRQSSRLGGLLRALDDASVPRRAPEAGLSLTMEPATFPYVLALRWIARPEARDELVEPVLTSELGALTPAAARGVLRETRAEGKPPAAALAVTGGLAPDELDHLATVRATLEEAERVASSVSRAFEVLWKHLPLSRRLVAGDGSLAARRDLDAVMALARAVERAGGSADASVAAFVDVLEAGSEGPGPLGETDEAGDAVRVLTAHGTAGMELDTVIVAGAVEGDFPSLARPEPMFDLRALDGPTTRAASIRRRLEDERRLFGLVVGRARRRVVFTASDPHGDEEAVRSRFVHELGLSWQPIPRSFDGPVSVAEAATTWRRALADPAEPSASRLAAIDGVLALGVEPNRWWLRRDWTDTGRPLHEHLRLSYSRLENLENCELQFLLGTELGLSRPGGHQAWVGKLVHELIEDCENGKVDRTLDAMTAELERRWDQRMFPSRAVSDAFRLLATEKMLPNWFKNFGPSPALATEVAFTFEFADATIRGKIDRIGSHEPDGTRITDFKTGNAQKAPKAAQSLQLGIYFLAVNESEDLAEFRPVRAVDLAFLRGHWKTGEVPAHAWSISASGEEEYQGEMRDRLAGLIERIRTLQDAETWRPNPKADCFFCDFKSLCSLWPQGEPLFPIREGNDDAGARERTSS